MNELFDITPAEDPGGRLRFELTEDFDLARAGLESQIRTAPTRLGHLLAEAGIAPEVITDGVLPQFVRALQPVMDAFVAVVDALDRVYDASWVPEPEPAAVGVAVAAFNEATDRVVSAVADARGTFRLLTAVRTDLPEEVVIGPVTRAFSEAYIPIVFAAIEMVDGALGVGAGLQAHVEAARLPDTVPADWL